MYAGIASHVGSARGKQDGLGSVLAHIKDLTLTHGNGTAGKDGKPFGNAAYTTDAQVFHTDVGDLIALLALQTAKDGGTSRIASGARVYNELAKTRPDLLQVLSDPWPLDRYVCPYCLTGRSISRETCIFMCAASAATLLTRLVLCSTTLSPTLSSSTLADTSPGTAYRNAARIFRSSARPRLKPSTPCTTSRRSSLLGSISRRAISNSSTVWVCCTHGTRLSTILSTRGFFSSDWRQPH